MTTSLNIVFPKEWDQSDFYMFDEIAAIYEHYAKLPRLQAEMLAYWDMTLKKRVQDILTEEPRFADELREKFPAKQVDLFGNDTVVELSRKTYKKYGQ